MSSLLRPARPGQTCAHPRTRFQVRTTLRQAVTCLQGHSSGTEEPQFKGGPLPQSSGPALSSKGGGGRARPGTDLGAARQPQMDFTVSNNGKIRRITLPDRCISCQITFQRSGAKVYWSAARTLLCIPCGCFHTSAMELNHRRNTRPAKPKRLALCPLQEKLADPCFTASVFFRGSVKKRSY